MVVVVLLLRTMFGVAVAVLVQAGSPAGQLVGGVQTPFVQLGGSGLQVGCVQPVGAVV